MMNKGNLFIISAPSGAGKTTLCNAVLKHFTQMCFSISHTTRKPRGNEQNSVEYYFISKQEFIKGIKEKRWAEWAEVYGNYYGTSWEVLNQGLKAGKDIIFDIDVQGAMQLVEKYPDAVTIFIMPPDFDTLQKRIKSRGTDTPEVIKKRLEIAKKEIAKKNFYKHIIINGDLNQAVNNLISIIELYKKN